VSQTESVPSFVVGGELRERFESVDNAGFGLDEPADNDYLLHRADVFFDFKRSDELRGRVELVGGFTSGWSGSPPPTQDDPLDLLQAYVEPSLRVASGRLAVRIGREQLALGSSRLVSIREGPNIRRAFDGVRAIWTRGAGRSVTAFFARPVFPEDGTFDDRSSSEQRFSGVYSTRPIGGVEGVGVDDYYLRLDRAAALFAQGVARERRHTVGARGFGKRGGWDWNAEGAWQWGSFGEASIRAWTLSVDAGFTFAGAPLAPRLGLKVDEISGDRDLNDAKLGTFNPLFPRLPYFSEANLATPANLRDVQPSVRLTLSDRVTLSVSWDGLRKFAQADAFYAPPLSPVPGTAMSVGSRIGWQASTLVEWQLRNHLELDATYVSFEPSSVMNDAGGRAGSFVGAWLQWTF
jgi:hypothetical protein